MDYSIHLETDLNLLWNQLQVPNRPSPNGNIVGDPVLVFHNRLQTFKINWSSSYIIPNPPPQTLGQVMRTVVRHILDPGQNTLLYGPYYFLDDIKINNWIDNQDSTAFGSRVITTDQLGYILAQVVNMGRYNPSTGYIQLLSGDKVGVIIKLQTSPHNILTLRLFLQQI
jgi:hypothetical protein